MIIVRENNEGEYSEIGGRLNRGTPDEAAVQVAMFTRRGCDRVIRYAFVGQPDAARAVVAAVERVVKEGTRLTRDRGGTASTSDVGRTIAELVESRNVEELGT